MASSTTVAFTRNVDAAWTRWTQRTSATVVDVSAQTSSDLQLQYELLAAGVAATLSDDAIHSIWRDESEDTGETIWSLLTPLAQRYEDDNQRVHFLLVVIAELVNLGGESLTQGEGVRGIARSLWLVESLVMPIIKSRAYQRLHAIALTIATQLVAIGGDRVAALVSERVFTSLLSEEEERGADDGEDRDQLSYVSLCRLCQIVLNATDAVVRVAELNEQIQRVCLAAVERFDSQPRFLRAVSVNLMPSLIDATPAAIETLVQKAIGTWETSASAAAVAAAGPKMRASSRPAQGAFTGSQVCNLLYMLCILLPKDPTLIREPGLQQLVAFALTHEDKLMRKQALHLLKISFSHYALDVASDSSELDVWQSFLLASDVIQLHHEQHLLEQVWPQVEHLLQRLLVVPAKLTSTSQWPVKFTFPWIQSLLMRVFRHENPVVRRMFLSNFMQTCVDQLQREPQVNQVHPDAFVADPLFEAFVFQRALSACNDPLMYKSSRREAFQALIVQFYSAFLRFKLSTGVATPALINTFLRSACDAVFGPGTDVHSPEAIISSLEALEDPTLQESVNQKVNLVASLDEASVETVRAMLETYVLRSFPLSMQHKLLQSLLHALTRGFTRSDALSLHCLARVLTIFPLSYLALANGAPLRAIQQWLTATNGQFTSGVSTWIRAFLTSGDAKLTPDQLARLLLFTAALEDGESSLVLQQPVAQLIGDVAQFNASELENVVLVLGALEVELRELGARVFTGVGLSDSDSSVNCPLAFRPVGFYSGGGLSLERVFHIALARSEQWLTQVNHRTAGTATGSTELEDDQLQYEQDVVNASALLMTQLATFSMEEAGDLALINTLSDFCDKLKSYLASHRSASSASSASSAKQQLQDLALVARVLAIASSQPLAMDTIAALHAESLLPLLLAVEASRAGTNSSRYVSDCLFLFASSKWKTVCHVLHASAYVPSSLLRRVFDQCVATLFSAGSDPSMLTDMVHVLSVTLSRLGSGLHTDLHEVFTEIWTAYGHVKPKPDSLTRTVIFCLFQPAILRRNELVDTLIKPWIKTLVAYGEAHRPNVLFHLSCRLAQVWRVDPQAAVPFTDEIVELLLYREPVISEKEKSPSALPDSYAEAEDHRVVATVRGTNSSSLSAKGAFVRFIILSFLDEMSVDSEHERLLVDAVLAKLLATNFGTDWHKQQMLNSDAFGRRLRSWQAITVLIKHVTVATVQRTSELIWRAFAANQLPPIRFYMEVVGMRLAMRFPSVTVPQFVLPLLRDFNLVPQVGASVLLVAGFFINHTLVGAGTAGTNSSDTQAFARTLLTSLLPWLNASHGHTRVMVQFLIGVLLPRYLHTLELAGSSDQELAFFQAMARYLSENKESKRMFRRQSKQFDAFQPEFQCSLLGLLSSSGLNEFHELLPDEDAVSISAQLKHAMNRLYEQFQREHFAFERAMKAPTASTAATIVPTSTASTTINVQRKIDTSAILLDESMLPLAMKDRDELVELNVRQKPRQPVILCASLVDKVPNLAGLARTCEIFNAQRLVVPSLRVCEDEAFQTIAVTANKWIPMEQVKEEALVSRLVQWKLEGYTIVAVEQTASSQCLSSVVFPEKMVIVLGKEKEGIPVDVLQVVDVCVEIPQFGLIRSLNVHVSGAILLWEYTQQRIVSGRL